MLEHMENRFRKSNLNTVLNDQAYYLKHKKNSSITVIHRISHEFWPKIVYIISRLKIINKSKESKEGVMISQIDVR